MSEGLLGRCTGAARFELACANGLTDSAFAIAGNVAGLADGINDSIFEHRIDSQTGSRQELMHADSGWNLAGC